MAPGRPQGSSCWTCRLRRKRCNAARPICSSCQSLDIPCHAGERRPSWMDGGAAQRHMTEIIKDKIKHNALLRRERRNLMHDGHQHVITTIDLDPDFAPDTLVSAHYSHSNSPASLNSKASAPTNSSAGTSSSSAFDSSLAQSDESQSSFPTPASSSHLIHISHEPWSSESYQPAAALPIPMQLSSTMIYLDYVFPFLFPFYNPSLMETGRQWLLGLLCQNEASFHIAASLSAYFFTLVPQADNQAMHSDCAALVRDRLLVQMDMAVGAMQSTVASVTRDGMHARLLDQTRVMEEITQLLIVEITVRTNVDWTIHLTPALALFDDLFKNHGLDNAEPSLAFLLQALPSSIPRNIPHHKPLPNTADQSALIFFVALLLYVDIIASTSLGSRPTLQDYHQNLLSSHGGKASRAQLEAIIGCQNWPLVAVGDISTLCAWKHGAKQRGDYSVVNLVSLAAPISQALEEGFAALDNQTITSPSTQSGMSRLTSYYSRHDKTITQNTIADITRIWAYAARIYLAVTLSGWQTNPADIRDSVSRMLTLLQTIESPAQLRSLSWPICLAGCLALPHQEHEFGRIIEVMGPFCEFGTVGESLRIMQAVWKSRDAIDGNTWDIATALNILGSSALLL